jgi:hypothetical protein
MITYLKKARNGVRLSSASVGKPWFIMMDLGVVSGVVPVTMLTTGSIFVIKKMLLCSH